jgi:hypothetical protein
MLSHWENWLYLKSAEVGLAGIVPGAIQEAQITRLRDACCGEPLIRRLTG